MANRLIEAFAKVEIGHAAPAVKNDFLVLFEPLGRTDPWMGEQPMERFRIDDAALEPQ